MFLYFQQFSPPLTVSLSQDIVNEQYVFCNVTNKPSAPSFSKTALSIVLIEEQLLREVTMWNGSISQHAQSLSKTLNTHCKALVMSALVLRNVS